ncbi:MAG: hypothetical protein WA840_19960, partial [Caulobacteraceae bacterium]
PIPVGSATYLGTFYATANGQTSMQFAPAPASGGSSNVLGLWNAYNRVAYATTEQDLSSTLWSIPATTSMINNSSAERITFVDGLAQSAVYAGIGWKVFTQNNFVALWINENTTTGEGTLNQAVTSNIDAATFMNVTQTFTPSLGLNYIQAMSTSGVNTNQLLPSNGGMTATIEM